MKKAIIKGVIVSFVFMITLFVVSNIMNKGNTDMTMEMGKATYPIISIEYEGFHINELHGYADAMEVSQMRESITPLGEGRKIELRINPYGRKIEEIAFEVRSLDGNRLIENTRIGDYEQKENEVIPVSFGLKDLIESNQEYMLVILLTLDDESVVRYYTRVVSTEEYHVNEKLEYIADFSRRTFSKEDARELTKYLESNADGDNTTYGKVTIHSSFHQVTWGNLEVKKESRSEIMIKELGPSTGSFVVEYYVSVPEAALKEDSSDTSDQAGEPLEEADLEEETFSMPQQKGENKKLYRIKEFYRVRYTTDRMYLLDFERTMDQMFEAADDVYANNKIMLGITSGEVPLKESDGGNVFAFVTGNRLYSYNIVDNKMALLFGFYNEDNLDERTLYDGHKIKILNVDEGGNVTFLVYGYMSRGRHEGQVGISVYYYESTVNTVEEMIYIPFYNSQTLLIEEIDQLSYINRNNMLYLKWGSRIYGINLMKRTCEVVVENLSEGSYKVSDSNRMAVWQKEGDSYGGKELVLMNLTTGKQKAIEAGRGEVIAPIGFMGEDLIYGVARQEDIVKDVAGNTVFPMYKIRIEDETEGVLMSYQQDNVYITDGEVIGNQIVLSRVEKTQEGTYAAIKDDQIMNAETETESKNSVEIAVTERFEKLTQIAVKTAIDEASMKQLTPREVLFEGERNISLPVFEGQAGRYYVYGKSGLESICTNEGSAVNLADAISGVVIDEGGYYVWTKGNRELRNQIMAIQGETVTEEKDSLAICLDTMLAYEGVVRNSEYMLKKGETVVDILRDSLPSVQVLDLTGCSLDAVLYYVNQDIPVLVMLNDGSAVLLVGFNEKNTVVMNPESTDLENGTVYKVGMNDSKEWFEQNGNCFITYIRNEE
ncbi:hypothetical protein D7V94_13880 [Parablautia intestinalis]|uniref:Peptidase C39 domain-containing protein n=1 Tax=Parablautia intestinalis TaxID=2320100 RepID=A0A3A9AGV2_9FIRM|nr:hypothetical protein [Parablautia intestinalis]RKI90508.1 hypothetical protein D7V94_13880 [Parablautia intestinalis]